MKITIKILTVLGKVLLTIIYPFWFFLARTWLGGMLMIFIVLGVVPLLIYLIFPEFNNLSGEYAEAVGIGIAIVTILSSPIAAIPFIVVSGVLEEFYNYLGYGTEEIF